MRVTSRWKTWKEEYGKHAPGKEPLYTVLTRYLDGQIIIIIIIIIIMSLGSVSAPKDVIEDPSRPGTNNIYYWNQDERKGRKCWTPTSFHFTRQIKKGRNLW